MPPVEELDPQVEEETQAPRRSPRRIILWIVTLAAGLALLPLYQTSLTLKRASSDMDLQLTNTFATLTATAPPSDEEVQLSEQLDVLRSSQSQIQPAIQMFDQAHIDWPRVMATIGGYDPLRISLTRISQSGRQITVNGQAQSQTAVTEYADVIRNSELFGRVMIQAINVVALPTATPTSPEEVPPLVTSVAEFVLLLELSAVEVGNAQ